MRAADPSGGSFLDIRTPVKLPDALRGERYAFVMLPLSEFRQGGDITVDNIGVGKLCPLLDEDMELPSDSFVQGIVIFSSRAEGTYLNSQKEKTLFQLSGVVHRTQTTNHRTFLLYYYYFFLILFSK
jgi:hypothetical protein